MHEDGRRAAQWAAGVLAEGQALILDTETTGLDIWAEVCSVALIDLAGATLLDTLVRPTRPIPESARRIHGITDEQVATAPTFPEVWTALQPLLSRRPVLIFNADFDTRLLMQSGMQADMRHSDLYPGNPDGGPQLQIGGAQSYTCVMHWYSAWCGDWSDHHGSYRWQPLPGGDHTALGDCRAALALLRRMAASREE